MESHGCYTPSGGRATSSAPRFGGALARLTGRFDRLPIRVRLAAASTALTFVILLGFAVTVGELTVKRIRADFEHQVAAAATDLRNNLVITLGPDGRVSSVDPNLAAYAAHEHAAIRVAAQDGTNLLQTPGAPNLGPVSTDTNTVSGYRVENRLGSFVYRGSPFGELILQYGRPLSDLEATVARVRLLLVLGVLGGTGLALLAGLMIARRAMAPVARLTQAASEIALTRDPSRHVPRPEADDEVAELARTLDGMLGALESSRSETQAMLDQQRRFVADASHELRTPLTSVLANLELLAETLRGEEGETARAALRSSQRMRRLVADLLMLARNDIGRPLPREPIDLGSVITEAAGELEPAADQHQLILDPRPVLIEGARDELLRLTINLVENALRHTPARTTVRVSTETTQEGRARVVVEDDGPGVPEEIAPQLFERFVRGAGDRGGSFGLGLAIVRAIAESHGGAVTVGSPERGRGARFVVELPALAPAPATRADGRQPMFTG